MKVIFIKDLKKQGKVNDIKEVSDGYATNFLIKNGYAVKYTKTSLSILDKDMEEKRQLDIKNREEAKNLGDKISKMALEFKMATNNGKVFGSVSSKQIVEELSKNGIKIEKKQVNIDGAISSLGVHRVDINLYKDVVAKLNVKVVEK